MNTSVNLQFFFLDLKMFFQIVRIPWPQTQLARLFMPVFAAVADRVLGKQPIAIITDFNYGTKCVLRRTIEFQKQKHHRQQSRPCTARRCLARPTTELSPNFQSIKMFKTVIYFVKTVIKVFGVSTFNAERHS